MQDFKDLLWRLTITAIIWITARFIPSFIQLLFNMKGGTLLSSLIVLGLLLLAWYSAGTISKWKYPKTIATNLGILGTLNGVGIVFYILAAIYSVDCDFLIVLLSLIAPGLYVWLCYILSEEAKDRYKTLYGSDKT